MPTTLRAVVSAAVSAAFLGEETWSELDTPAGALAATVAPGPERTAAGCAVVVRLIVLWTAVSKLVPLSYYHGLTQFFLP